MSNSSNSESDLERGKDPENIRIGTPSVTPVLSSHPQTRQDLRKRLENYLIDRPKKRQDGIWPYLLIRAYSNDHGVRQPPPNPFWESPDIIVVPGQVTNFDGSQSTLHPSPNVPHTIFVRVWNLGRLPAFGVRLRVYWANPSFSFNDPTSPGYPHFIGGAYLNLSSRYQFDSHIVSRISAPWIPIIENDGHECLLAKVDCFADRTGPDFNANTDRHVGQKNLFLASPQEDLAHLFDSLGLSIGPKVTIQLLTPETKKHQKIIIESFSLQREDTLSKLIAKVLGIKDVRTKTVFSRLDTTQLRIQAVKGRNIVGGYTVLANLRQNYSGAQNKR
jgi:hypothetical protein